jgi:hypothetical protein
MRIHRPGKVLMTAVLAIFAGTCGMSISAWADGFEQGPACKYAGTKGLSPQKVYFTTVPGRSYTPDVHEFTDSEKEPASNFEVTVNWGDGTSSPATVSGEGCYEVTAPSHTYSAPGTYAFSETVRDAHTGLEHTVGSEPFYVLSVLPAPAFASPVPTLQITAGLPWSGVLGEFKLNLLSQEPLSAYTASIEWGDGESSPGAISSPSFETLAVSGSHTYMGALSGPIDVKLSGGIETGSWTVADVQVRPKAPPIEAVTFKLTRQPILAAVQGAGRNQILRAPVPHKPPVPPHELRAHRSLAQLIRP